jgi:hypothetical protein
VGFTAARIAALGEVFSELPDPSLKPFPVLTTSPGTWLFVPVALAVPCSVALYALPVRAFWQYLCSLLYLGWHAMCCRHAGIAMESSSGAAKFGGLKGTAAEKFALWDRNWAGGGGSMTIAENGKRVRASSPVAASFREPRSV